MKIIFAGTPQFAASALEALFTNNYEVIAVLTQPDRPAGRGMQLLPSPVKQVALRHGITVLQPVTLKTDEAQRELAKFQADVMVVAAYGLILPQQVLQMPKFGCLNIHASLLPRWRGAAPIQRAILAGDAETGITIMQMDQGLDTGKMLLKKTCLIAPHDTAQTLHAKLAITGASAIVETLLMLQSGNINGEEQNSEFATYAGKLVKAEAKIDWTDSAFELERAIRAYNPTPVAYSTLNDTNIKIWQAVATDIGKDKPGKILAVNKQHIQVACGDGSLLIEILQRPNGKALPVAQFIQGFTVKIGDCFTTN